MAHIKLTAYPNEKETFCSDNIIDSTKNSSSCLVINGLLYDVIIRLHENIFIEKDGETIFQLDYKTDLPLFYNFFININDTKVTLIKRKNSKMRNMYGCIGSRNKILLFLGTELEKYFCRKNEELYMSKDEINSLSNNEILDIIDILRLRKKNHLKNFLKMLIKNNLFKNINPDMEITEEQIIKNLSGNGKRNEIPVLMEMNKQIKDIVNNQISEIYLNSKLIKNRL